MIITGSNAKLYIYKDTKNYLKIYRQKYKVCIWAAVSFTTWDTAKVRIKTNILF